MTLKKAIKLLEVEFECAKNQEWIHNPLAYALYQVWKRADADHHNEKGGVDNA